MKRRLLPLAMLLSVVFTVASCLSNDDTEYVYTDDTAITSFSVGTLNQYVNTKTSDGKRDSTYKKTVDCSSYKFYIRQTYGPDSLCEIYNNDSLPYGIDAKKVLCTIGTKSSGVVVVKSMTSDSVSYFNSSDSLDFSGKDGRVFTVYSNSGRMSRKYRIRVNVHKEEADSFKWRPVGTSSEIAGLTAMRALACNGRLFVVGTVDGKSTVVYTSADGKTWKPTTPNFNHVHAADAYKYIVAQGDYIYLCDGMSVMRSKDGSEWDEVARGQGLPARLVAASPVRIYGYTSDNRLMESADNGKTWTDSQTDEDMNLLPTENISSCWLPSITNKNTYHIILTGLRAASFGDTAPVIWGKTDEGGEGSANQPWAFYDIDSFDHFTLPFIENIQTTAYDGSLLAVGGKSISGTVHTAFDNVWRSQDGGITWKSDSLLAFTDGMKAAARASSYAFVADAENYIWMICGGSGQIWKGRINRLGWIKQPDYFTKE